LVKFGLIYAANLAALTSFYNCASLKINAIELKKFYIISKQDLLIMKSLVSFDKSVQNNARNKAIRDTKLLSLSILESSAKWK
jgi:hypothetical protein